MALASWSARTRPSKPARCSSPRLAWKSQRGQDAWVAESFGGDPRGRARFFVDLASQEPACDSNTWALEQRGWRGLCIEAAPEYVAKLRKHRRCTVVEAAVDATQRSNASFLLLGGYGGLVAPDVDNTRPDPRGFMEKSANVTTRSLGDVLAAATAPSTIDYLSLDVEGAENRVLSEAVLRTYIFLSLTIERPHPAVCARLFAHGYLFVRYARALPTHKPHTLPVPTYYPRTAYAQPHTRA